MMVVELLIHLWVLANYWSIIHLLVGIGQLFKYNLLYEQDDALRI